MDGLWGRLVGPFLGGGGGNDKDAGGSKEDPATDQTPGTRTEIETDWGGEEQPTLGELIDQIHILLNELERANGMIVELENTDSE